MTISSKSRRNALRMKRRPSTSTSRRGLRAARLTKTESWPMAEECVKSSTKKLMESKFSRNNGYDNIRAKTCRREKPRHRLIHGYRAKSKDSFSDEDEEQSELLVDEEIAMEYGQLRKGFFSSSRSPPIVCMEAKYTEETHVFVQPSNQSYYCPEKISTSSVDNTKSCTEWNSRDRKESEALVEEQINDTRSPFNATDRQHDVAIVSDDCEPQQNTADHKIEHYSSKSISVHPGNMVKSHTSEKSIETRDDEFPSSSGSCSSRGGTGTPYCKKSSPSDCSAPPLKQARIETSCLKRSILNHVTSERNASLLSKKKSAAVGKHDEEEQYVIEEEQRPRRPFLSQQKSGVEGISPPPYLQTDDYQHSSTNSRILQALAQFQSEEASQHDDVLLLLLKAQDEQKRQMTMACTIMEAAVSLQRQHNVNNYLPQGLYGTGSSNLCFGGTNDWRRGSAAFGAATCDPNLLSTVLASRREELLRENLALGHHFASSSLGPSIAGTSSTLLEQLVTWNIAKPSFYGIP